MELGSNALPSIPALVSAVQKPLRHARSSTGRSPPRWEDLERTELTLREPFDNGEDM